MFGGQENVNENEEEFIMTRRLKNLAIAAIVLAVARIIPLDLMFMISDLLSALMIYFYAISKTKCMAIFSGINGVIGIIYGFVKLIPAWNLAKANWFNIYQSICCLIPIYAIVIYSILCYMSYIGIRKYEMMGFGMPQSSSNENLARYNVSSNYGALPNNNNEKGYTAFGGKGTTLV